MTKKKTQGSQKKTLKKNPKGLQRNAVLNSVRFAGVSLSGGKSDKTCLVFLDYYPQQKKLILSKLVEKIKTEEFLSGDLKIHELIAPLQDQLLSVAFDVPLTLPKCVVCKLKCPGYESCNEPEIRYSQEIQRQDAHKKRPRKLHTPYTQRCVETYLAHAEQELDVHHALGANLAPLTARAMFIARRLQIRCIEVFPKLSVWRLGRELRINKTHLKVYRNAVGGNEARESFLKAMNLFMYEQDRLQLIDNFHAFDALICAYTAYLEYLGKTEPRPEGFPKKEAWMAIPMTPQRVIHD